MKYYGLVDTVEYSVPLALQDFVPVLLSSIGVFFLAQWVGKMSANARIGRIAYLGAWLIMLGGGLKAVWKLTLALSGVDVAWMNDALFILMGPGFTCLAWAFYVSWRRMDGKLLSGWMDQGFPFVITGLFLFVSTVLAIRNPDTRSWFLVLLGLTTVANFTLSGMAIHLSWRKKLRLAAFLFAANLLCILLLQGLARIPREDEILEWTAQLINTASNLAFVVACYQLNRFVLNPTEMKSTQR